MPKITQDNRTLRLATPLGKDVLLINGFTAHEKLSGLFSVDVEMLHHHETDTEGPPKDIPMKDILGKDATVTVEQPDGTTRYFNGIVSRFALFNRDADFTHYRMEIVPKLWLLTLVSQSRIFQNKSVREIVKDVVAGIEFKDECTGSYHPRNYCVQYRETDFNFISRLMEEEGIFYFFEHTENSHKMIIADTPQSCRDCESKSTIEFVEKTAETDEGFVSSIQRWTHYYQLQSGKVTSWDYHFQLPTSKFDATQPTPDDIRIPATAEAEIYDYPGGYAKCHDGIDGGGRDQPDEIQRIFQDSRRHAAIAAQVLNVQYKTIHGASDCSSLTTGKRFTLVNHPLQSANGLHVVTGVEHSGTQSPDYLSQSSAEAPYANTFTCIPYSVPFRPALATFKPVVQGSQTAVVVGPSGEEIFTDKYGRVKVQFHWDREGRNDAGSSCWLRVGTSIAGNKWGTMFIPRIGQEVIVDFLEGDPDQPIIVGAVYNPLTMPHYELPKFKTLSYIKTRTSPDDGKGFNELRFEDKQGKEQVFVHSQKRYDLRVRGSMYETCGGNRHEVIGMRSDNKPGGNLAISVGGNYDLHVKEAQYIGIDKKLNESVKEDVVESYQQSQQTFVTNKIELNAKEITIEGSSKVQLKVGSSCVILDLSGVTIKGPMVKINPMVAMVPPTGPAIVDAPLDAESADTGEPGYLDRPRTGGGGGGRRRTTLTGQHAPIVTDQAFALTRAMGTADDMDRALVAAELSRMPPHILTRMQNNGTTVAVCRNSVTEVRQDLRGVQPRSWPAGTTWDTVPGLNDPNTNQVIIATRGHGTPEGAHVPRSGDGHGSSNLVIHEAMHSVDEHGPGGNHHSATDQNFNNARNGDPAIMGDSYEGTANPAGAEEAYAESAARYYGGDPNDAANHPGMHNYWAGDPLNPNPPAPAPAPAGP